LAFQEDQNRDLTNFNRTQYFADIGLGMRFPVGAKSTLFAEARYQFGLSNLDNVPAADAGIDVFGLNVGYLFRL
jgi:hypothetical protein